jgi:GH24 family phage-related lysozyme (muramidase)
MAKYNPKDWTRAHEGFKDHFYFDSKGKLTIGVGHLVTPSSPYYDKELVKKAKSIFNQNKKNPEKANKLLNKEYFKRNKKELLKTYDEDYAYHAKMAEDVFPNFKRHPQNVQDSLINMTFQLGNKPKKWNQLQHNLQIGLETGDYSGAASAAADSQWFKNQTAKRARSVLDRMAFGSEYTYDSKQKNKYNSEDIKSIYGDFDKTDNKAVHSTIELKEEEVTPEAEEQGFFGRVGDFFSDTFGIGAEASEVPPMEELEQPREEVPMMSPTDAMRAQSQGRVVLDSHDSIPPLTNPEAGPSDTIKAVLTPGEAVIPAAAAQNPENEEKIQELLVEGRVKNDIAEANGVPVTDPAIAQIPKERLYDNVELDEYHRRNLTGKYGGGEQSLPGFAGGTMEVPSMMMMAPPKDPTMDEMKRIALKQMGYEQKSKNRTRDTVEKIGLKHLEETATADMKQMALDETMRNYGAQVPAPMQPVPQAPQGFKDGTGKTFNPEGYTQEELYADRPNLSTGESLFAGIAGEKTSPFREMSDADVAEIANFGDTSVKQDEAMNELTFRQAQVPTGAEVPPVNSNAPIKIAGSDVTIAPQPPTKVATIADLTPEKPATPATPTPTPGKGGNEEGFLEGLGTFGKVLGKVFDPESMMTAGVYYGVNRLLGYNNEVASQQALIGYTSGQKERAARVDYARRLGLSEAGDAQQAAAKRDESANRNIRTLTKDIASQLTSELSAEDLEELGVSRDEQANVLASLIQRRGIDLSTPEGLNAASALASGVSASYARKLKSGGDPSMADTFDRHLLSQFELTEALTDSEGRPLSTSATRSAFDTIRRNVKADSSIKDDQAQFVFEDRVNQAYQIFKDPANVEKVQALRDQGLLTPAAGENEFSLFLDHILKSKNSRVRTF